MRGTIARRLRKEAGDQEISSERLYKVPRNAQGGISSGTWRLYAQGRLKYKKLKKAYYASSRT